MDGLKFFFCISCSFVSTLSIIVPEVLFEEASRKHLLVPLRGALIE